LEPDSPARYAPVSSAPVPVGPTRVIIARPGGTMPNASRFIAAIALLFTAGLQDTAADDARRVDAGHGHVYLVSESHPVGASLSDLRVRLETPATLPREVSLRDRDPLREAFAGDLDGNGVPELYLVTQSAGSGSYASIIAVLPGPDAALIAVEPPAPADADFAPGAPFAGYGGHDRWSIEGSRLVRTFPLHRPGDVNAAPGGGTRRIVYALTQQEGGAALLPATGSSSR
jgi:hypothetical protein